MKYSLPFILIPISISGCSGFGNATKNQATPIEVEICSLVPKHLVNTGKFIAKTATKDDYAISIDKRHCTNNLEIDTLNPIQTVFRHSFESRENGVNMLRSTTQTITNSQLGDKEKFGRFAHYHQRSDQYEFFSDWSGRTQPLNGALYALDFKHGKSCETSPDIKVFSRCTGVWSKLLVDGEEAKRMIEYTSSISR